MATPKIRASTGPTPDVPGSRRAHWQALVAAHERSGLTRAAFCQQRGLRKGTLSFWRWKFAREAATAPRATPPPRFVPVQLAPSAVGLRSPSSGEVEIALGPRRCVRVRGPVDPGWLTTVTARWRSRSYEGTMTSLLLPGDAAGEQAEHESVDLLAPGAAQDPLERKPAVRASLSATR